MKKTILMITGAMIVAALIAAGSFWGGMKYQSSQTDQIRANFFNARGGQGNGVPGQGFPAGSGMTAPGQGFPGGADPTAMARSGGMGNRGGTSGQVKSLDKNVLTISTAQDVVVVVLSDSTRIQKSVAGTTADLVPGTRVMVTGQRDDKGNLTASQITILDANAPQLPAPQATPTAAP